MKYHPLQQAKCTGQKMRFLSLDYWTQGGEVYQAPWVDIWLSFINIFQSYLTESKNATQIYLYMQMTLSLVFWWFWFVVIILFLYLLHEFRTKWRDRWFVMEWGGCILNISLDYFPAFYSTNLSTFNLLHHYHSIIHDSQHWILRCISFLICQTIQAILLQGSKALECSFNHFDTIFFPVYCLFNLIKLLAVNRWFSL